MHRIDNLNYMKGGEEMKLMKIIVGLVLIAAGIWAYFGIEDATMMWISSIVLVVLGVVILVGGLKKKDDSAGPTPTETGGDTGTTPPAPPTPPENPAPPVQ